MGLSSITLWNREHIQNGCLCDGMIHRRFVWVDLQSELIQSTEQHPPLITDATSLKSFLTIHTLVLGICCDHQILNIP